jgi:endonuclease/exonuclease/phosphatase (EEP) superfamily protein YafD
VIDEAGEAAICPASSFLFFKCLMIPLDHCLVSDDIRVADARTGEPMGSDHLPLIVEIELEVEQ